MASLLTEEGSSPIAGQSASDGAGPVDATDAERSCVELTAAEARYMLAVFDLGREGVPLTQAEVARRIGVSNPTVLQMIRRLRKLELIHEDSVQLTGRGSSAALVLHSRREAAQVLAHDVLGLPDEQAKAEAEALAVNVSPLLGRRLVAWRAAQR